MTTVEPHLLDKKPPTLPPVHTFSLTVNGTDTQLDLAPWTSLLDALREYLNLTGTKKGCDHGQCGACTVLVDGKRINSCMTLAIMQEGKQITTIEGLAEGEAGKPNQNGTALASASQLHPLQQAFIDHDAFQCGYCTPGQICSAVGLINEGRVHTAADIQELMSGNICRCGAYPHIVDAISEVMNIPRDTRS